MKSKSKVSMYQFMRQMMALMLSMLLIPLAQLDLRAQEPPPQAAYAPLDAVQLDQLVAPIALYPDALVAQVLTASTYPDQVAEADNWSQQNAGLPPAQRAAIANGMNWDPSIKALTAFPSVLDNLARNNNWSSQLGNAYYNQPTDVMNAVQAMRYQAQQSGALASTPQQRVYADNGVIVIAPVDPGLVYVPYYNPWRLWGPTFVAYPGYYMFPPPRGLALGLGLGFGLGISIGLFAHYGWGYGAWAPNWRGGGVFYNHGAYYSRSVTVYNHGHYGGYNRGVFEHEGRGVPGGFHASASRGGVGPAARPGASAGAGPAGRSAVARPGGSPGARAGGPAGGPAGRSAAARPGGSPGARAGASPAARSAGAGGRPGAASGGSPRTAARPAGSARPGAAAGTPGAHGGAGGHTNGGGGGHAPAAKSAPAAKRPSPK